MRNWLAIATRTSIYFFTSANGVSEEGYERVALMPHFAGDISSHKEGDPSRFMLMDNAYAFYETGFVNGFTVPAGHWGNPDVMPGVGVGNLIRSFTLKDGAVPAAIAKSGIGTYSSDRLALGGVGAPFPDPVTDGLLLERALVCEGPGVVRGYLPGVYVPLHVRPFADCEIVNDVAGVDGAVLMAKATYGASGSRPVGNQGYFGQFLFDLSTPW
ncbi:hypothetical protein [Stenotrophomonas sp. SPM]|uniref:hypothetical protein n=1 Tax=Stenotrophomonas sp. SPM TaxID=2170735 RepID=UPI0010577A22|nr:hypothetical protein [Stenotrophomonas sp. SPM]